MISPVTFAHSQFIFEMASGERIPSGFRCTIPSCEYSTPENGLKSFDLIYVLTNGGPVHATEVPSTLMINLLFLRNRYGMGSTIAVMLIILCFVFALLINMLFRKDKVV